MGAKGVEGQTRGTAELVFLSLAFDSWTRM